MKKKIWKSPAVRVSLWTIAVNLLLALLKLIAGFVGHSQALLADAVHSASDVLTTVIVIASLFISGKAPDSDHEYGHQKFESLAALFLGILLGEVGMKIGFGGADSLMSGSYRTAAAPTLFAAAAALGSVAIKEVMYHATMTVAKRERSNALRSDAWHNRSDALSSVGSFAGILFAMNGFPIMDPIASLIICVFILKAAADIILDSAKALTDSACDKKTENAISDAVLAFPEVLNIDVLRTRIFGSGLYVDMEISIDRSTSFEDAHRVAEAVHDHIEESFPNVWHCMVHVNPAAVQ